MKMSNTKTKKYQREWYLLNRKRIIEKSKEWYKNHKGYRLQYLKNRAKRDEFLRRLRFVKNPEKYRNQNSLWMHKNAKRIAKKREAERIERYNDNQERTPSSIKYQKYNDGEIEFLKNNYKIMTTVQLAIRIDRTYAAVSRKLGKLGLIKVPRRIDKLIKNYKKL